MILESIWYLIRPIKLNRRLDMGCKKKGTGKGKSEEKKPKGKKDKK